MPTRTPTPILLRERLVSIINEDLADMLADFGEDLPGDFIATDNWTEAESYGEFVFVRDAEPKRGAQSPDWCDAELLYVIEIYRFGVDEQTASDAAIRMRSAITTILRRRMLSEHAYWTDCTIAGDGPHEVSTNLSPVLYGIPLPVTLKRRVSISGTDYPDM